MTKYIANKANLKMMMNLLRYKTKNIQFEAFHVFKVGVLLPFFDSVSEDFLDFKKNQQIRKLEFQFSCFAKNSLLRQLR
jgi:Mo25-like